MFHWFGLIIIGLLVATNATSASLEEAAKDPSWQKLLHYENRMARGLRSRVINEEFFFSAEATPLSELTAFAAATKDPNARVRPFDRHPQCAFPARFSWLKENIPDNYPKIDCVEFEEWRKRLDVSSVRLVLASAYANNPASMFGHTILKFVGGPSKPALLDYGVTFLAATGNDDNPFLYTWKGLTGGYTASYQLDPYYTTVSIYTKGESRDLWEYDIPLTDVARERLVMHLWEVLFQARFSYYFLDENCSYMLLALLEAAEPSWSWTRQQELLVLPLETIRKLGPLLTQEPTFRPSSRRELETNFARLNGDERNDFFVLRGQSDRQRLTQASVPTLDTLASAASYTRFAKKMEVSAKEKGAFDAVLRERAHRGAEPGVIIPQPPSQPLDGHKPRAVQGGIAWENGRPSSVLRYRFGLHDFLNDAAGYESFATIRYLELGLRFDPQRKKVFLDDSRIADVTSLRPWSQVVREFSWHLALGADRLREPPCSSCATFFAEAAGGVATDFGSSAFMSYVMALYRHEVARPFRGQQRLGPGILGGFAVQTNPWRFHAEARVISETWRPQSYVSSKGEKKFRSWRARYDVSESFTITKNSDLRLEGTYLPLKDIAQKDYKDLRLTGTVFF